jgi:hypothetical protein
VSAGAAEAGEPAPRERVGRAFRFNTKGKYTAQAEQLRKDAALEALKQRIAATARKAGLDSEFEAVAPGIKRAAPPDAEWWDAALLPTGSYADLAMGVAALNITTPDSPITLYVQHPIPLPAPAEQDKAALKPLKLTTREQKKLTKGRRQAVLQDHRDRIKMGLIPPDPPKGRPGVLCGRDARTDARRSPAGEPDEGAHVGRDPGPDQGRGPGPARGRRPQAQPREDERRAQAHRRGAARQARGEEGRRGEEGHLRRRLPVRAPLRSVQDMTG